MALLSSHIPKPYESLTRYYGYYSCRSRGERKKKIIRKSENEFEQIPESETKPTSTWVYLAVALGRRRAMCIKKIYEIDPLECPRCKSQMRIVAFLQDPAALLKISKSLGLPDFRAPPKIPACHAVAPEEQRREFSDTPTDDIPNYDEF